jgi:GAF domain-containing protein
MSHRACRAALPACVAEAGPRSACRYEGVGPKERFYAGAPLVASSGHRLGTLCMGHDRPKDLTAGEARLAAIKTPLASNHTSVA